LQAGACRQLLDGRRQFRKAADARHIVLLDRWFRRASDKVFGVIRHGERACNVDAAAAFEASFLTGYLI
jgi:hypothetical protein